MDVDILLLELGAEDEYAYINSLRRTPELSNKIKD